jgi:hypothetical protein
MVPLSALSAPDSPWASGRSEPPVLGGWAVGLETSSSGVGAADDRRFLAVGEDSDSSIVLLLAGTPHVSHTPFAPIVPPQPT